MAGLQDFVTKVKRMPLKWKILLSSQLMFTLVAFRWRQTLVENRRKELLAEGGDAVSNQ
jgi:hypothetical protein